MPSAHLPVSFWCPQQESTKSPTTALQTCVWRNDRAGVQWLLTTGGANTEIPDEHGLTPLLLDVMRVTIQQMRSRHLPRSSAVGRRAVLEVGTRELDAFNRKRKQIVD